jgi:tetratricopeptide (TPR) repeat protein
MTGLSERVAETALEDLTDRAILFSDPEAHTYILPPLAAEFIRTRRPDAVAKTGDTLVDTVYALAVQYGGFDNYDGFRILDSEWNLIAAALPRLLTGDNSRLQTVCVNLFKFFYFSGRWDDGLWLSERAETYAIAADDKVNAGFRAHDAGWIYNLRNTPADLLVCAVRASEHFKTSTSTNKASATRLRGLGHRLNGDYPTAITAFREVLELHRSISPESENVAICLNDIANTELRNGDDSSAERDFCEALRIAKKVNYQEGVATYTGNLAILALSRKQWVEAETLAREALIIAQKVGRQSSIASNYSYIAEALLNQNRNLSEAVSFANRAVEIFTRLKSPSLQWARDILEQLERVLAK